ncbi:unnamed protein product [Cercospora beticola]|nr:unnamed protein product [Cercospora beticola]
MQFTTFAFAAVLLSPLALAQAPASSFGVPNPNDIAEDDYCQCVGFTGAPNDVPNNQYTDKVCMGWAGALSIMNGSFRQCTNVSPDAITGFSNTCASYGEAGARGAKCCKRGQAWSECQMVIPGENGGKCS